MWAYLLICTLCAWSVPFFIHALSHPYLKRLELSTKWHLLSAIFGLILGSLSYLHMYHEPYSLVEKAMVYLFISGVIYLYSLYAMGHTARASFMSVCALALIYLLQNGLLMILWITFPDKSDVLKEFLLWIRPLLYAIDFTFAGLMIQKYGGFGIIERIISSGLNQGYAYSRYRKFSLVHVGILIVFTLLLIQEVNFAYRWFENYKIEKVVHYEILIFPVLLTVLMAIAYRIMMKKTESDQIFESANQLVTYSAIINTLSKEEYTYRNEIEKTFSRVEKCIESDDVQGLKALNQSFADLNESFDESTYKFLMSLMPLQHKVLKGLVVSKLSKIRDLEINFEASIGDGVDPIQIPPVELSRLVGILLDNAIEAAAQSDSKHVVFVVSRNEEDLEIIVKNTYSSLPDLSELYKNGYSTKGYGRGQGLGSFKKILSKHKKLDATLRIEKEYFVHGIRVRA